MLISAMATTIQAGTGASRWCETAFATLAVAETFLQIFPETTFLCLHRNLQGVLAEGMVTYHWSLGGSPFWPYSEWHPGNNAATIAAYWAACTEPLLDFEANHQHSCLRIRFEDLLADPYHQIREIFTRLGLDSRDLIDPDRMLDFLGLPEREDANSGPPLPTELMPSYLLTKVHQLHAILDYTP